MIIVSTAFISSASFTASSTIQLLRPLHLFAVYFFGDGYLKTAGNLPAGFSTAMFFALSSEVSFQKHWSS